MEKGKFPSWLDCYVDNYKISLCSGRISTKVYRAAFAGSVDELTKMLNETNINGKYHEGWSCLHVCVAKKSTTNSVF